MTAVPRCLLVWTPQSCFPCTPWKRTSRDRWHVRSRFLPTQDPTSGILRRDLVVTPSSLLSWDIGPSNMWPQWKGDPMSCTLESRSHLVGEQDTLLPLGCWSLRHRGKEGHCIHIVRQAESRFRLCHFPGLTVNKVTHLLQASYSSYAKIMQKSFLTCPLHKLLNETHVIMDMKVLYKL